MSSSPGQVKATPAFLNATANALETNQQQAIGINKQAYALAIPLTSADWQGRTAKAAQQVVHHLETDGANLVGLLGMNVEAIRQVARDMGGQEDVGSSTIQKTNPAAGTGNGLGLNRPTTDPRA